MRIVKFGKAHMLVLEEFENTYKLVRLDGKILNASKAVFTDVTTGKRYREAVDTFNCMIQSGELEKKLSDSEVT